MCSAIFTFTVRKLEIEATTDTVNFWKSLKSRKTSHKAVVGPALCSMVKYVGVERNLSSNGYCILKICMYHQSHPISIVSGNNLYSRL